MPYISDKQAAIRDNYLNLLDRLPFDRISSFLPVEAQKDFEGLRRQYETGVFDRRTVIASVLEPYPPRFIRKLYLKQRDFILKIIADTPDVQVLDDEARLKEAINYR